MKTTILLCILTCFVLMGCSTKKNLEQASFLKMEKVILKEEFPAQFLYWDLENNKQLWETKLGDVSYLLKYRDSLKLVLGASVYEEAVKKEASQNLEKTLIASAEDGDRKNALLVHTGTLGELRKINFLEAQILNYQIKRFPLLSHPTEFHGFIAMHENEQKIRIYFCSSDTEWPPKPQILIEQLEKDIKEGWRLKYHLHNHYCKEDKNYVGILAPSLADAQYFKMLAERFNVEKALITNGFHTVELQPSEFHRFESH